MNEIASTIDRAVKENHTTDIAALELNSYKMSANLTFQGNNIFFIIKYLNTRFACSLDSETCIAR